MKFVKGIMLGSLVTTGVMMMWNDNEMTTKKLTKKGKILIRKIGIL